MVQVQLAYSHENKKGLVAKCSSFIGLCSWEPSEGKDGKVEAPGCEVETGEVIKLLSRESPRGHVFDSRRTPFTKAVWGLWGSFPAQK